MNTNNNLTWLRISNTVHEHTVTLQSFTLAADYNHIHATSSSQQYSGSESENLRVPTATTLTVTPHTVAADHEHLSLCSEFDCKR